MDAPLRLRVEPKPIPGRRASLTAMSRLNNLAAYLASIAILAVGAVVAVAFAATLTFVMVLASILLGLASVTWRLRARPVLRRALTQSSRSGHAWIAYDWKRQSR